MSITDLDLARWRELRCFLLDADGVLYRGATAIPGARELVNTLRARDLPFGIITNNAMATVEQYVAKLAGIGMDVPAEAIFTSGKSTAQYLARERPNGAPVYAIGLAGLIEPLRAAGFWLDEERPEYVCVGLDPTVTYAKLKTACLAIRAGATFIGTNPDRTLPTEEGVVPGNGSILAALQACTDVAPIVIGKPEPTMLTLAMASLGARPEETAIIGDRLDTDILAGQRAGIATILVLTGISTAAEAQVATPPPDLVVDDLTTLRRLVFD